MKTTARKHRLLWGGGIVVAVAIVLMAVPRGSIGFAGRAARSTTLPPGYPIVAKLVKEHRAAWRSAQQQRVIEAARQQLQGLLPVVQWVLARPRQELFAEVAELAAACQLVEVREVLAATADSTEPALLRAVAVRAAERIEAWGDEGLAVLLADEAPEVVVAALECFGARENRPAGPVLPLLGHPDSTVQSAAVAALPTTFTDGDVKALLAMADEGDSSGTAALRALARCQWTDAVAAALVERFARMDAEMQRLVLDASLKNQRLLPEGMVWDIVRSDADLPLRAVALQSFEVREEFDVEALRDELPNLPARLRYFGARCLLHRGDREGIATLLDLAADPGVGADEQLAAKELLSRLSGKALHHGIEAWREWFENTPSINPVTTLPVAPF